MQNINRVIITGNLTRDPELKTFGEARVCNMRIAVNSRVRQQGEWVDKANYFDVVTFGNSAENCAKYLKKGRPIGVDGRLDWREWDDANSGGKRQAVQIIADSVQFLDSGARSEQSGGSDFAAAPATSAPADDDIPF